MPQQTAIEYFIEQMAQYDVNITRMPYTFKALCDIAKEMEKAQIMKAYNESFRLRDKPYETAQKYFEETFKK
jgi:hypothetical protein